MIDNLPYFCQQNDADFNSSIFRILNHDNSTAYKTDFYLEDPLSSPVQGFQSFPPGKCGAIPALSSSTFQHTPPNSRTPSPEQDRIFKFDTGLHPCSPLGPITPPPSTGLPMSESYSSTLKSPRTRALSPISPPSNSGHPMSDLFSSLPATNRAKPFSPVSPPATSGLQDGFSSPLPSNRSGLLLSPTSSSLDAVPNLLDTVPNLFQDLRWSPGQLSSPVATPDAIGAERKAVIRSDSGSTDPTYTWSGQLPPRVYKNPVYSIKVFLGGVPWDITEAGLQQAFRQFGTVKVEWPGKDGKQSRHPPKVLTSSPPKGYVYLLFESERSIKALLSNCTHDFSNGGDWYYKISSRRMRSKEVQVIPWVLSDSNHAKNVTQKLDSKKTVFVGGLHGMINAEALAMIMNDLFDGVIYAGIDTDKHKYPIGSGRVTFSNAHSYSKAVQAAFIEIRTPKFTKKVQIDPYLEDSMCRTCNINPGPFFCRDPECFRYFCRSCWNWHHSIESLKHHRPMSRHSKSSSTSY